MADQDKVVWFEVTTNFFQQIRALESKVQRELPTAINRESERLMTMAKRLTPVDTGTLRASGRVEGPDFDLGGRVVFHLAYGGPAIGYALRVHEDLMMHHTVGMAKFLETPVREEVGTGRSEQRVLRDLQKLGAL